MEKQKKGPPTPLSPTAFIPLRAGTGQSTRAKCSNPTATPGIEPGTRYSGKPLHQTDRHNRNANVHIYRDKVVPSLYEDRRRAHFHILIFDDGVSVTYCMIACSFLFMHIARRAHRAVISSISRESLRQYTKIPP